MSTENLDAAIERAGSPVEFLRSSQYPAFEFLVQGEFSNWRSEQIAWRETCVLLDQSHHMSNLFIKGANALRFLCEHGINSFMSFAPRMAQQYVAVNRGVPLCSCQAALGVTG